MTNVASKLVDIGFGASQVIPVIQAALEEEVGPLLVEEPEIHLHPRAQGVVGDLLCVTSRRRQVIIETHSVHMVNRARLMVAHGRLPPEHVLVLYVSKDRRGSHIESIAVGKDGEFEKEWPEGFFEERYRDTLELMSLKSSEE